MLKRQVNGVGRKKKSAPVQQQDVDMEPPLVASSNAKLSKRPRTNKSSSASTKVPTVRSTPIDPETFRVTWEKLLPATKTVWTQLVACQDPKKRAALLDDATLLTPVAKQVQSQHQLMEMFRLEDSKKFDEVQSVMTTLTQQLQTLYPASQSPQAAMQLWINTIIMLHGSDDMARQLNAHILSLPPWIVNVIYLSLFARILKQGSVKAVIQAKLGCIAHNQLYAQWLRAGFQ